MNSSKDVAENHSDESEKKSKSSTGKRKFHQKSRKGCSTCKKRRVKCDENKPSCNKCVHMKLDCGYLTDHLSYNRSEEEEEAEQQSKKRKVITKSPTLASDVSINSPETQQATPALTPSPPSLGLSDRKPSLEDDTPGRIPSFPKSYLSSNGNLDMSSSGSMNSSNFEAAANAATIGSAGSNAAVPDLPSLLQAGNLNNINLSHLVNNLSGMGTDLSSLGNLANLSSLASLAQLPIDLSSISSFLESAPNLTGSLASIASQFQNSANTAQGSNPIIKEEDLGEQSNGGNDAQSNNGLDSSNNSGIPNISPNNNTTNPMSNPLAGAMNSSALNMLDLRLMFHYTSQVSNTITGAGISDTNIWNYDIPMLAFDHPFLMHAILAFSATHLSRTEKGLDQCVTCHRGDALRLLREAVLNINADNTDALVASALILIMDSLANASFPSSTSPKSLPASAWIFHVKGAATILTAVWPLTEASRFYKFISVDLGDIGEIINQKVHITKDGTGNNRYFTDLECHDSDIADLFPVEIDSPYLITLAYLNKLHKERYKSDFILRIFAFPALLDKSFLSLLMMGDIKAMRIMRSYYKLLRSFTTELKDKVWFLEGVSSVLPVDVEEYAGGAGGMTMMLDFLGGGPSIGDNNDLGDDIAKFDPQGLLATKLVDTDNLPSDITSNLEVMQGDDAGFIDMK